MGEFDLTDQVPILRIELAPGRSALWWAKLAARLLIFAILLTLCFAALMVVRDIAPPALEAVLVTIIGTLMAVAWLAGLTVNWLFFRAKFREFRSGYTTMVGDGQEYPQVEPTQGWVIRAAGKPLLTRAQWEAACARVVREAPPTS